jgi:hypothetical protein
MKLKIYNLAEGKDRQLRDTVSIVDGKLAYNGDYGEWYLAGIRMYLQHSLKREPTPEELLRQCAKTLPNVELIEEGE